MPITGSSAKRVDALVTALGSESAVERDTAVARLTVVGARAVAQLVALVGSGAPPPARIAALGALEAIADSHAAGAVLDAMDDAEPTVAAAAADATRAFLRGSHESLVVDRLTGAALDRARHRSVRVAALRVLTALGASTIAPLFAALTTDPDDAVRSAATGPPSAIRSIEREPIDEVIRAAEEGLPEDPVRLREAVLRAASAAPLPALLRIVERGRERESTQPASRRLQWTALRGAVHVALAGRGSRLAVYDLRESLETARAPLPADFLAALDRVGDASCLEPIAAAYARSTRPAEEDWRQHLLEAFRGIVTRERLTNRHAAIKKIKRRWKRALDELWARRTGEAGRAGRGGKAER